MPIFQLFIDHFSARSHSITAIIGPYFLTDGKISAKDNVCHLDFFYGMKNRMSLKEKTIFVTGASRGIGLAIALRAAREGAHIVAAAKKSAHRSIFPGHV